MIGIYKITSPSGRVYIGQSWNIKERWRGYHKGHSKYQPLLHNSFLKYGVEEHVFEIIQDLSENSEQNTLNFYEQLYMDLYRSFGVPLLNLREGGIGGKLAEETKRKLSLLRKGKCTGIENHRYGTHHSQESKNNLSQKMKGRVFSEETLNKMRLAQKGKIISQTQRAQISKTLKGRKTKPCSDELKAKLSASSPFKRPIIQLTKAGEIIRHWDSLSQAAKVLNLNISHITRACKYETRTEGGFKWKYLQNK